MTGAPLTPEAAAATAAGTAGVTLSAIATEAAREELPAIVRVAQAVAGRLSSGGSLFTFGAGHAQAFAMELCSRAGGLPGVVAMNLEDLRPEPRPSHRQLADSAPEREPANGPALLSLHGVGPSDALVIASQSGRNGAAVEMAIAARDAGTYVAAFTSLRHSRSVASRHPSGLRLFEVADDAVDNHCPPGDAAVVLEDGTTVSGASTVVFVLLAQQLNAALVAALARLGEPVRVLVSANVDSPTGGIRSSR